MWFFQLLTGFSTAVRVEQEQEPLNYINFLDFTYYELSNLSI